MSVDGPRAISLAEAAKLYAGLKLKLVKIRAGPDGGSINVYPPSVGLGPGDYRLELEAGDQATGAVIPLLALNSAAIILVAPQTVLDFTFTGKRTYLKELAIVNNNATLGLWTITITVPGLPAVVWVNSVLCGIANFDMDNVEIPQGTRILIQGASNAVATILFTASLTGRVEV